MLEGDATSQPPHSLPEDGRTEEGREATRVTAATAQVERSALWLQRRADQHVALPLLTS